MAIFMLNFPIDPSNFQAFFNIPIDPVTILYRVSYVKKYHVDQPLTGHLTFTIHLRHVKFKMSYVFNRTSNGVVKILR